VFVKLAKAYKLWGRWSKAESL